MYDLVFDLFVKVGCHSFIMNTINLLLVGAGGGAGTIARYLTVVFVERRMNAALPYGTLTVNIAGSFILGVILAWLAGRTGSASDQWRLLLGTGFCGGFTTFSAFAADNLMLLEQRLPVLGLSYIALSIAGGLFAVWIGFAISRTLF